MATKMLSKGMSIDDISDMIGLSVKEIREMSSKK
jgi:transposase